MEYSNKERIENAVKALRYIGRPISVDTIFYMFNPGVLTREEIKEYFKVTIPSDREEKGL